MQLLATETLQVLPPAILPRLISMFDSTTPGMLADIRQHADNGDLPAMGQAAHKLKGSCSSMGAVHMANLCKELQHKGETGDASNVNDMVTELEAIFPATLEALKQAA